MNFQLAAIVAGSAFLLSFLSGLAGGVPFLDIILRALLWAVVGFGGSLGIETLLRSLIPDLFVPGEAPAFEEESASGRSVDITLEEDLPRAGFVEEVDEDEAAVHRTVPGPRIPAQHPGAEAREHTVPGTAPTAQQEEGEEEMPEISSFLDAFKPESSESGEETQTAAPEFGEYAPVEPDRRSPSGEVTINGEVQDPVILAKAVQTVMKRDSQGN